MKTLALNQFISIGIALFFALGHTGDIRLRPAIAYCIVSMLLAIVITIALMNSDFKWLALPAYLVAITTSIAAELTIELGLPIGEMTPETIQRALFFGLLIFMIGALAGATAKLLHLSSVFMFSAFLAHAYAVFSVLVDREIGAWTIASIAFLIIFALLACIRPGKLQHVR